MMKNEVKEILCKQLELLAEESKNIPGACDLAIISQAMVEIAELLI
jgi:hypothetical protein